MDDSLRELAHEAEKSFSTKMDFSDKGSLCRAVSGVLEHLAKHKIGPAVLSLLVVFAFPEESRDNIWQGIKRVVRESRKTL